MLPISEAATPRDCEVSQLFIQPLVLKSPFLWQPGNSGHVRRSFNQLCQGLLNFTFTVPWYHQLCWVYVTSWLIVESESRILWVFEQDCWGQPVNLDISVNSIHPTKWSVRGPTFRFGKSLHQSEEPWQHMMFFMILIYDLGRFSAYRPPQETHCNTIP